MHSSPGIAKPEVDDESNTENLEMKKEKLVKLPEKMKGRMKEHRSWLSRKFPRTTVSLQEATWLPVVRPRTKEEKKQKPETGSSKNRQRKSVL